MSEVRSLRRTRDLNASNRSELLIELQRVDDEDADGSDVDVGLIVLGCVVGLVLCVAFFSVVQCVFKRYLAGCLFSASTHLSTSNQSAVRVEPPAANFYTADQFEHRGPLEVRAGVDPSGEVGDHLPIEADENSADARLKFTDGPGNVVFDIGEGVEVVVTS